MPASRKSPLRQAPQPQARPPATAKLAGLPQAALFFFCLFASHAHGQTTGTSILPTGTLAGQYFGNDAPWYTANVPFFDCSDPEITQIYYYRWTLYKSHLKDLGNLGYISTEFLGDVSWARSPYQGLNDATAYHLHEGRWLRSGRYANDYIDYMYSDGGNDRHFSESIADAVYATYLARGDLASAAKYLKPMQAVYDAWADHYDSSKGLYWIEPVDDATEYTIASIDASNGSDGFSGGESFRPSINSFMYANALAISKLASLTGDSATAGTYASRAAAIKSNLQASLWNTGFQHFTDRFYVSNPNATVATVAYWNFIRGRELVGYTPWYYELPDDNSTYAAAWSHLLSSAPLAGAYGLRTNEPSYQFYMRQYRYAGTSPECQWNGPSWPFQTTLVLGAMANLLNDYKQSVVGADDYVGLLKQYAHLHYVNGSPDLQEDYNPDTGNVIVGLARSHHYNHSSYPDLVITGLAGLRPRADNTLEINPLVPTNSAPAHPLTYLCLENVPYHGHLVTVVYDQDGTHYGRGTGLSVYVDGQQAVAPSPLGKKTVAISAPVVNNPAPLVDLAVNYTQKVYPAPSASYNNNSAALFPALDGRVWFWPNVANYWTNAGTTNATDWFAVDFGAGKTLNTVNLSFYGDGTAYNAPSSYDIQSWTGSAWTSVTHLQKSPATPAANAENTATFDPVATSKIRVVLTNPLPLAVALVEFKAMGDPSGVKYVDLRATDASAGSSSWANQGSAGAFTRVGTPALTANVGNTGIPGVLFNGTTDAYQGPNTTLDVDAGSDRSIEVWAYNPSLADEETMVSWGYRGSTRQNLAFNFGSNANWGSVTHYSDDVAWGGAPPSANAWHHLVYTYSDLEAKVYVDGALCASKTLGAELNTFASQPINLGCQRASAGGARNMFYSGYLNAVRVYGGVLTDQQIAADYAAGPAVLPAVPSGLSAKRIGATKVALNWTPVAHAASYTIARSADGGATWTQIGTSPTASYEDDTAGAGTAYQYRVQASNQYGASSASTASAAVATPYIQWKIDTGLGANAADGADPDGDGQSNAAEYTAGTNPLNGSDVFKVASVLSGAGGYQVTVNGKAGRAYTLQRSPSLVSAVWTAIATQGALASDAQVTLLDPSPPAGGAFYRVVVSFTGP